MQYSDITKKQKKRFLIFLVVYFLGFFFLSLIGDSINDNGYVFTAFLAPATILIGIIGIIWSLYPKSNADKSDKP